MSIGEVVVTSGRLPIKESGRTVFVQLDEVEYFEASGNYVRVHAGEAHYRVREKLSTMETRLPERDFVRIHRSVIVNRNRIHELRRSFSGKYLVTLVSGKQVTLSRSHRQQLSGLNEATGLSGSSLFYAMRHGHCSPPCLDPEESECGGPDQETRRAFPEFP